MEEKEVWSQVDDFFINDKRKTISCPHTWMEAYGVSHFPIPIFTLWKKHGYVLQLNIF